MQRITITITIDDGADPPPADPPADQVETGATVIHVDQPRYVGFAPDLGEQAPDRDP